MISIIETGALLNPDMTPMNAASATLVGLSRDSKPTNAGNGWIFSEIDTGKIYIFDAENSTWREWSGGSGGGGGGSDSSVLVVHYVEGTLDKTWQEIYDAFVSGKVVSMLVDDGGNYFFAIATNIFDLDGESYYVYFSFVDGELLSVGFATTTATGYPTRVM